MRTVMLALAVLAAPLARAEPADAPGGSLVLLGVRAGPTTPQLFNALSTNVLVDVEGVWGPARSGPALFLDLGYTQPVERGTRIDGRFTANGGKVSYAMTVQ